MFFGVLPRVGPLPLKTTGSILKSEDYMVHDLRVGMGRYAESRGLLSPIVRGMA